MSTRDLVWIRAPQQARSQATLARLLDATEVLLDEAPFDDLSVQDICKAAKSSVGAFYARFADKGLSFVSDDHGVLRPSTTNVGTAPDR